MAMTAAVTALSTAYTMYSTYKDTQAHNAMLDYNSDMEMYNADIADLQADDAEERGAIQERMEYMKAANLAGVHKTTEVGGGEGGAEINVGSRYDSVEDIAVNGDMMGKLAMRNAKVDAWNLRNRATAHKTNAKMLTSQKASSFDIGLSTVMSGAKGMGTVGEGLTPAIKAGYSSLFPGSTIATGLGSDAFSGPNGNSPGGIDYRGLNSGNY
jgi:hypothetical protein